MYLWNKEEGNEHKTTLWYQYIVFVLDLKSNQKEICTLKGDNKEHCYALWNSLSQELSIAKSSLISGEMSCPPPLFMLVLTLTSTDMGLVYAHNCCDFICVIDLL